MRIREKEVVADDGNIYGKEGLLRQLPCPKTTGTLLEELVKILTVFVKIQSVKVLEKLMKPRRVIVLESVRVPVEW